MSMPCAQDQSSLAALLEKNDELGLQGGGIAEAERLYEIFTPNQSTFTSIEH